MNTKNQCQELLINRVWSGSFCTDWEEKIPFILHIEKESVGSQIHLAGDLGTAKPLRLSVNFGCIPCFSSFPNKVHTFLDRYSALITTQKSINSLQRKYSYNYAIVNLDGKSGVQISQLVFLCNRTFPSQLCLTVNPSLRTQDVCKKKILFIKLRLTFLWHISCIKHDPVRESQCKNGLFAIHMLSSLWKETSAAYQHYCAMAEGLFQSVTSKCSEGSCQLQSIVRKLSYIRENLSPSKKKSLSGM